MAIDVMLHTLNLRTNNFLFFRSKKGLSRNCYEKYLHFITIFSINRVERCYLYINLTLENSLLSQRKTLTYLLRLSSSSTKLFLLHHNKDNQFRHNFFFIFLLLIHMFSSMLFIRFLPFSLYIGYNIIIIKELSRYIILSTYSFHFWCYKIVVSHHVSNVLGMFLAS